MRWKEHQKLRILRALFLLLILLPLGLIPPVFVAATDFSLDKIGQNFLEDAPAALFAAGDFVGKSLADAARSASVWKEDASANLKAGARSFVRDFSQGVEAVTGEVLPDVWRLAKNAGAGVKTVAGKTLEFPGVLGDAFNKSVSAGAGATIDLARTANRTIVVIGGAGKTASDGLASGIAAVGQKTSAAADASARGVVGSAKDLADAFGQTMGLAGDVLGTARSDVSHGLRQFDYNAKTAAATGQASLASFFGGIKSHIRDTARRWLGIEYSPSNGQLSTNDRISNDQEFLEDDQRVRPSENQPAPIVQNIYPEKETQTKEVQIKEIQTIHTKEVQTKTETVVVDGGTKDRVEYISRQMDSDRPNYSLGQSFSLPANLVGRRLGIGDTSDYDNFTVDEDGNVNAQTLTAAGDVTVQGNFTVIGAQTFSGAAALNASTTIPLFAIDQSGAGAAFRADNITLKGSTISTSDTDTNLLINPNGTGAVQFHTAANYIDSTGNLVLDGDITLTSGGTFYTTDNGNLVFAPNGTGNLVVGDTDNTASIVPFADSTLGYDLGSSAQRWYDIYAKGKIDIDQTALSRSSLDFVSAGAITTGASQDLTLLPGAGGKTRITDGTDYVDIADGTQALYAVKGATAAKLADGTYAVDATGDIRLSGDITVSGGRLNFGASAESIDNQTANLLKLTTGGNARVVLGDDAGTYQFQIADSDGNVVASIDSDGKAVLAGISSSGDISPATDLGASLGDAAHRFNDIYVANINTSGMSTSGQAVFTYQPLSTDFAQSSVLINPSSAIAGAPLLGVGVAGAPKFFVDRDGAGYFAGNVGIGTTSPGGALHVAGGQCVTGDTLLRVRRRRKKKNERGEWIEEEYFEDVRIDQIKPGDEILTLDENTGRLVVSRVNALMDMGVKEIYKLTTAAGKTIRTTANHPYLAVDKFDDERVAVFIDSANFEMSCRFCGLEKDYVKMDKFFFGAAGKNTKMLRFYKVDFGGIKQRKFFNFLNIIGAKIVSKPIKVIKQKQKANEHKANFDVELAVDAVELKEKYDMAIIVSGDSDFAYLTKHLQKSGKKTIVVSPWRRTGKELRGQADMYFDLNDMPFVGRIGIKKPPVGGINPGFSPALPILSQVHPFVKGAGKWKKVSDLREGQMIAVVGDNGKPQYERIAKIEKLPAEQVYDIEVEGTHNFVGNGIVAHNTYLMGNVGIGTTSPAGALHVAGGQCVTGDSELAIVDEFEKNQIQKIQIKDIRPEMEVLSLNEDTGRLEPHTINKLLDMGVKPVFKLTTQSGKTIRTTANHPYLAKKPEHQISEPEINSGVKSVNPEYLTEEYEFADARILWEENKKPALADSLTSSSLTQNLGLSPDSIIGGNEKFVKGQTENGSRIVEVGGIEPPNSWVTIQNPRQATPTTNEFYHKENDGAKWTKLIYLHPGDYIAVASLDSQLSDFGQVLWDRIKFIEYVGEEQVYDIEVEGTHNFVGNGIVAHNTYLMGDTGIGTTAPSSRLHVVGADTSTSTVAQIGGSSGTGLVVLNNGNVGIGTTSPGGALHVAGGQCVTGDTLLRVRRRRKKKNERGEWIEEEYFEDVRIDQIKPGDEILTLDENTGRLVVSRVNALMDMGVKEIYKLTTAAGKTIRTTANHPYLARKSALPGRTYVFIDASNIIYGCRESRWRMDFKKLYSYLKNRFNASRVIYYAGEDLANAKQQEFYNLLRKWGYELVVKPTKTYDDGNGKIIKKANVDVDLTFEAMLYFGEYDRAVFFTGDGDFYRLIAHCETNKEKVWVFGNARRTAKELKTLLGYRFSDLDDLRKSFEFIKQNETDPTIVSASRFMNPSYQAKNCVSRGDGQGRWTKVADLREGMEIAAADETSGNAVWEQIAKIEKLPPEQVYDIEVEGTHNFVGNGIVAHNTYLMGDTGIGTTTPGAKLDVRGGIAAGTNGTEFLVSDGGNITAGTYNGLTLASQLTGFTLSGGTAAKTLALNDNLDAAGVNTHIADTANPHNVTKSQINLGNVENTALSTWPGTLNITTLGTIGAGTWNGSVISPVYGGTGVANNAANTIAFTGNYSLGLTLTSNTSLILPASGTLATLNGTETLTNKTLTTPTIADLIGAKIRPAADSATALQFTKADGTNILNIDTTNGRVGIGTTNPQQKIEVAGNILTEGRVMAYGTESNPAFTFSNDTHTGLYRPANDNLGFSLGGAEKVRIDSTGNVGIGTTSPSYKLDVNGTLNASATSTFAGRVGIGTTAPGTSLDILGAANSNILTVRNNSTGLNYASILLQSGNGNSNAQAQIRLGTEDVVLASSYLAFLTRNSASIVGEAMRITSTGNVGIGTTSPAELLDVNGRLRLAPTTAPETIADKLYNVSGNLVWNGVNLTAGGALPSGAEGQLLYNNAGAWTAFDGMYWDDENSRLGIGTTSPEYKLDVQGELGVGTGLYTALNGVHLYTGTVYSTNLTAKSNQNLTLGVATAGKNVIINPTSGNVGIGTTSLAAGYKLDVAGYINSAQEVNQGTYPTINASQTASVLQDGSAFTGTDATMATMYQAVQFTADAAHTMGDFTVRIKESADITNTTQYLTGYIYADDGGSPSKPTGAALATGISVRFGTLTTSYQILSMGTSYTLTAGTKYWLVLKYNAAPAGGNIVLDSDVSSNMGATSADGTNWTNTNVRLRYVIRGKTYYGGNFFSTNNIGIRSNSTNSYGVYGDSTNSYGVRGDSTNSIGVYGYSTNSYGVYGDSTNSIAVAGTSTNNYGVYGLSTNSVAGYLSINPATTNTVAEVLRLRRQTSGTAVNGIGGSVDFYTEDSAGTDELTGRIGNLLTTAASGGETSALTFWTRTGGAAIAERLRIDGSGNVGIGTIAPTSKFTVRGDSSGAVADLMRLENLGAAAANSGVGLQFIANRTTGGATEFGRIDMLATGIGDTDYSGALQFKIAANGLLETIAEFGNPNIVLNRPLQVNVAGDTGISYDLQFMSTGNSHITSNGPLTIAAGSINRAQNLILTTQSNEQAGDFGTAATTTATTLTDSSKAWTEDEWIGGAVTIVSGAGKGQTQTVTDNDATSITVADWDAALGDPAANSVYRLSYAPGGDILMNLANSNSIFGGFKILGNDNGGYAFRVAPDGNVYVGGEGAAGSNLFVKQNITGYGSILSLRQLDISSAGTPEATTAVSGGSCADSTAYYYKVTAINDNGETTGTAQFTVTTGASGSNINLNTIAWSTVTGATGYKIYRSTENNDWDGDANDQWVDGKVVAAPAVTYDDDCAADTASLTPPVENTTGGKLAINAAGSTRRFEVLENTSAIPQMKIVSDSSNYAEFYVDATGDLNLKLTGSGGDDLTLLNENMKICAGGDFGSVSCPASGFSISGTGNLIVENKVVANDFERICPDGYVWVPGSAKFGTMPGFCVMKYEAKNEGSVPTSKAADAPWVSVSQEAARAYCQSLGAGYHLVSEPEWMTIAENIAATPINDIDAGAGLQLATGHTDNDPTNALAAGTDPAVSACNLRLPLSDAANAFTDNCQLRDSGAVYGYSGTGNQWDTTGYSAGGNNKSQLRVHALSNGNTVWDIAGNVWEWTDAIISQVDQPDIGNDGGATVGNWGEWNVARYLIGAAANSRPPDDGWTAANGIGRLWTYGRDETASTTYRAFLRGGSWGSTSYAGVFALNLNFSPANTSSIIGFRCAR